jgi:hypothetical protein
MSARPFQVGDRVVAAGLYDGEPAPGTIQTILDCAAKPGKHEAFACAFIRLDTPKTYDDGEPQPLAQVFLSADRTIPHDGEIIVLIPASEPVYLTINGLVMKRMSTDPDLEDLRDAGWDEIDAPEQDDDGTEAEALAEVQAPAFPDVLVHGRAGVA